MEGCTSTRYTNKNETASTNLDKIIFRYSHHCWENISLALKNSSVLIGCIFSSLRKSEVNIYHINEKRSVNIVFLTPSLASAKTVIVQGIGLFLLFHHHH